MITKQEIKKQLLSHCKRHLSTRRQAVELILDNVAISLRDETKSSAGDKHETGRAMLQLERENTGKQLAEIEKVEAVFYRIHPEISKGPIHLGSIVETSKANYFISIPAGEITIENKKYYSIGVGSPMGQLLMGSVEGDEIRFRKSVITIHNIY